MLKAMLEVLFSLWCYQCRVVIYFYLLRLTCFLSEEKTFFFFEPRCFGHKTMFFSLGPICFWHKTILLPPFVFKTLLSLDVLILRTRSISYLKLVNLW